MLHVYLWKKRYKGCEDYDDFIHPSVEKVVSVVALFLPFIMGCIKEVLI